MLGSLVHPSGAHAQSPYEPEACVKPRPYSWLGPVPNPYSLIDGGWLNLNTPSAGTAIPAVPATDFGEPKTGPISGVGAAGCVVWNGRFLPVRFEVFTSPPPEAPSMKPGQWKAYSCAAPESIVVIGDVRVTVLDPDNPNSNGSWAEVASWIMPLKITVAPSFKGQFAAGTIRFGSGHAGSVVVRMWTDAYPPYVDYYGLQHTVDRCSGLPVRNLWLEYGSALNSQGVISEVEKALPSPVPDTVIEEGPPSVTNSTSATFKFRSTQPGSSFECRLDSAAWEACSSPKTYTSLPDGTHLFEVRAKNPIGQPDESPASRTWRVDTVPPDTTINSAPPQFSNSPTAEFTFSANEQDVTFECQLDSGPWERCLSPKRYVELAERSHTFQVRATDAAGNVEPTPASHTAAAPETSIDSGPSGTVGSANASFAFSSPKAGTSFECRLDSGLWGSCSSPKSYLALSDGAHRFQVRATDAAANTDPTPAERTWIIDTKAPALQLSGSLKDAADLNQPLTAARYELSVSASDGAKPNGGVRSIEVQASGGRLDYLEQPCPQGSCSLSLDSIFRTRDFAAGQHTVSVVATDELGQQAERSFTVTVPPDPRDSAIPDTLPCTGPNEPTNFQTYSLGPYFEGLPVTEVIRTCATPYPGEPVRTNSVAYLYGDVPYCPPEGSPLDQAANAAPDADSALCTVPLQIHSWPACERSLADYELEPGVPYPRVALGERRGVPAYSFDDGFRVELYTGTSTVVMFGPDAAQLLRGISAIRPEPISNPPGIPSLLSATSPSSNLPAPAPGATTGQLRCA